jgi:XTP/dITP diphosphohydrolase
MLPKLFLGTTNPIKIAIVQAAICSLPVEMLIPSDLGVNTQVEETGQTTLENARIKARAYCEVTSLPTLAIDGGLWIEKFPAEKQPDARVKRIAGTDGDVLEYYIRELERVGGESPCTWEGSLALAFPDGRLITDTYRTQYILTTKAHGNTVPGIALASITVNPLNRKYHSELAWGEYPDVEKIRAFLQKWSCSSCM